MELIERAGFLTSLRTKFKQATEGEGHCILISGEAGIGKTSLIKAFCREKKNNCKIFQGTCDALFTPRPLGPVHEIVLQIRSDIWHNNMNMADRASLFASLFYELGNRKEIIIIIIEDIHWADEATLDFIKFFARRISRLHCLLLLTYRDNEVHSTHLLRTVLGQLPPDSFSRLQLTPLSREAVEKMSVEKGYKGEDVYGISGGNPFYVAEILASYSQGVPENIRDSILSVYNRQDEKTKQVWQILSVLPTGFEVNYLKKMETSCDTAIEISLAGGILILKEEHIFFKHELYRRTIAGSLSPFVRLALNKKILDEFLEKFERNGELERIIHHAKNANDHEAVVKYAPIAAKQAASVGAHIEAARLWQSAIEYYQGNDQNTLIRFYQAYSYECYVTSQINEAIIYAERTLHLLEEKKDVEKTAVCLHFLSFVYWFTCNRKMAEFYASQAMDISNYRPSSRASAMAIAQMARLKMASDEKEDCLALSEKAMTIANELNDKEIICHALISMGSMLAKKHTTRQRGLEILQQSKDLALENNYEVYLAYIYANFASNTLTMKEYSSAKRILEEGIQFCEDRDFDLGTKYLLAYKARLLFETGNWNEAYSIANDLIADDVPPIIKIMCLTVAARLKMRNGDKDLLPLLIEAQEKSLKSLEPHRIIPAMTALLEYEWITGQSLVEKTVLEKAIDMIGSRGNIYENSEFAWWLLKVRGQKITINEFFEGFRTDTPPMALKAAVLWKKLGCPYEQALVLFEGGDDDKKAAIEIVHRLGAETIYEKMKFQMRTAGIRNIPRGMRKTTRSNPANLTEREMVILQLLKDGLQNKEIAAKLYIATKTANHHIYSIFSKLDVHSRSKAVSKATQLNIIK